MEHKVLFQTPQVNHQGKPYLTVKENDGYTYVERLGQHSVAFMLYDESREFHKFGLVYEYKPPLDMSLVTAFGGSFDQDTLSCANVVCTEVKEEAGYSVDDKMITEVGQMFVSTQMNQMCVLFLVDVTGQIPGERNPQSIHEETAKMLWVSEDEIFKGLCWKAITILTLAKQKGIL